MKSKTKKKGGLRGQPVKPSKQYRPMKKGPY